MRSAAPSVGSGLRDKLYWREIRSGFWCCFKKTVVIDDRKRRQIFMSLCGRHERTRSGGQDIRRPPPLQRCGRCDGLEADRRGWEQSAP